MLRILSISILSTILSTNVNAACGILEKYDKIFPYPSKKDRIEFSSFLLEKTNILLNSIPPITVQEEIRLSTKDPFEKIKISSSNEYKRDLSIKFSNDLTTILKAISDGKNIPKKEEVRYWAAYAALLSTTQYPDVIEELADNRIIGNKYYFGYITFSALSEDKPGNGFSNACRYQAGYIMNAIVLPYLGGKLEE